VCPFSPDILSPKILEEWTKTAGARKEVFVSCRGIPSKSEKTVSEGGGRADWKESGKG